MATSVVTTTLVKRTKTSAELVGIFSISIAAGDYTTGGFALPISSRIGYTNRQPDFVDIKGIAGYVYEYVASTRKFQIRQSAGSAAPLVELAAAATPAAVVADVIRAKVCYLTTPALPASA